MKEGLPHVGSVPLQARPLKQQYQERVFTCRASPSTAHIQVSSVLTLSSLDVSGPHTTFHSRIHEKCHQDYHIIITSSPSHTFGKFPRLGINNVFSLHKSSLRCSHRHELSVSQVSVCGSLESKIGRASCRERVSSPV